MIIIHINGGLGNQMFQYAFGRAISIKNNYDLYLDISSLSNEKNQNNREYGLSFFNIKAKIADKTVLTNIIDEKRIYKKYYKWISTYIRGFRPIKKKFELSFEYSEKNIEHADNVYYIGYWQSEKYFSDISRIIKEDFQIINPPSKKNDLILKKILAINSVSIHIRHGDYLHNITTNKFHGICSINYYLKSMKFIEENTIVDEYFVFTDDPIWAKNNLFSEKKITVIDWNFYEPHEDLRLMSSCKHHIMANSTFSWWGSYLGEHNKQIVIAPEPWFDNKAIQSKDIYLQKWIQISKK